MPFIPSSVAAGAAADLSSIWTSDVSESGASLANWTQESGSWTVASSSFNITTPATTQQRLRLTALKREAGFICQADVQMKSTGGYAADNRVGFLMGWDGSSNKGLFISLRSTGALTPSSTGQVYTEIQQNAAAGLTYANNFALDTFITLTAVVISGVADIFINGTYIGSSGGYTYATAVPMYFGLAAYNVQAAFRNIKTSVLSVPTFPL